MTKLQTLLTIETHPQTEVSSTTRRRSPRARLRPHRAFGSRAPKVLLLGAALGLIASGCSGDYGAAHGELSTLYAFDSGIPNEEPTFELADDRAAAARRRGLPSSLGGASESPPSLSPEPGDIDPAPEDTSPGGEPEGDYSPDRGDIDPPPDADPTAPCIPPFCPAIEPELGDIDPAPGSFTTPPPSCEDADLPPAIRKLFCPTLSRERYDTDWVWDGNRCWEYIEVQTVEFGGVTYEMTYRHIQCDYTLPPGANPPSSSMNHESCSVVVCQEDPESGEPTCWDATIECPRDNT